MLVRYAEGMGWAFHNWVGPNTLLTNGNDHEPSGIQNTQVDVCGACACYRVGLRHIRLSSGARRTAWSVSGKSPRCGLFRSRSARGEGIMVPSIGCRSGRDSRPSGLASDGYTLSPVRSETQAIEWRCDSRTDRPHGQPNRQPSDPPFAIGSGGWRSLTLDLSNENET